MTTALDAPARSWTVVGALASADRAVVDPHGVVLAWRGRWALEWAVGAEDRWYRAAHEPTVRQRLLADAPVVESRLRVPGGDVVHRTWAARPAGSEEVVLVVEIENQTPVPVALALGIGPGVGAPPVRTLALDGTSVSIDGRAAMVLGKAPARGAGGPGALDVVLAGDAGDVPATVEAAEGAPEAAVVLPLPHTAVLRLVILPGPHPWRTDPPRVEVAPEQLPDAEAVARGWSTQRGRGATVRVPDARVQAAHDAARATLLVLHDGPDVLDDLGEPLDPVAEALVLSALARGGFDVEAEEVLRGLPARLGADGWFDRNERHDTNGALLWALESLWSATGRDAVARDLAPHVAAAAGGIDRRRGGRRRRGGAPPGLLPTGPAPDWVGGAGVRFWDDLWAVRGLRSAATLLGAAGEDRAARAATASADELAARLRLALEASARDGLPGVGPDDPPGPAIDALLVGSALLGTLDEDVAHRVAAHGRERRGDAAGIVDEGGAIDVRASLLLALHEASVGDVRGRDALVRLVGAVGHALSLPDRLDPARRLGVGDVGHDPIAAALLVHAVRAMLLREHDEGVDLVPLAPAAWWGQRWELRGAPTRHGVASYAVRWRDEQPVLLWEVEPREPGTPVLVRAPGLAPDWSTTERSGELVLPPIAPPGGAAEERRRRRIDVAMGGAAAQNRTHGHAGHDEEHP